MRHAGRQRVKQHIQLPSHQIRNRQARALVGDVRDEYARLGLEQLGRQLHDGAVATGGVIELARVLLGVLDPLFHRLRRRAIGHQHDAGRIAHMGDGREVAHRVIRQLGANGGADGMGAGGGEQQGLTVCSRLGRHV